MKLTRRQEEFITNLHELNRELNGPIHYSLLAERLGVSPFTAYDMLCLLEEKGLASSEYQLASDKSGPGRAERLFYPTDKAHAKKEEMLRKAGEQVFDEESLKRFVLERIRGGGLPDNTFTREMLARIPPDTSDGRLSYCKEIFTIIFLRLRNSGNLKMFVQHAPTFNPDSSPASCSSLGAMAGYAFGVLVQEYGSDPAWVNQLSQHVKKYIETVNDLKPGELSELRSYIVELMEPIPAGSE